MILVLSARVEVPIIMLMFHLKLELMMDNMSLCSKSKYCTILTSNSVVIDFLVCFFPRCLSLVFSVFGADVIVLQCGVDTLVEDPMESFCLTSKGIGECFQFLLQKEIPMLVLGGGKDKQVH